MVYIIRKKALLRKEYNKSMAINIKLQRVYI